MLIVGWVKSLVLPFLEPELFRLFSFRRFVRRGGGLVQYIEVGVSSEPELRISSALKNPCEPEEMVQFQRFVRTGAKCVGLVLGSEFL